MLQFCYEINSFFEIREEQIREIRIGEVRVAECVLSIIYTTAKHAFDDKIKRQS